MPSTFRVGVLCPQDQDPAAWLKAYVEQKQPRLEFEWSLKNCLAFGRLESFEVDQAVVLSEETRR